MEDKPRDENSLLTLASRIDDDQPIDWELAEGAAHDARERAVLAELRLLASLTRVYRDPDAVGPNTEEDWHSTPSEPPVTWGSLTVLEPVGQGGFARVFRARDNLNREVALKLFPVAPHRAGEIASRVLREGSLLAKVKHHNVVVVHGVDRRDDHVGLWMEFISGRTVEEEIRARGTFGAHEAAAIGMDVCRALAAVHARGLLHRDVKAQNVMREVGGRTVLMDFGAGSEQILNGSGPADLAGTPLYIAPELFERKAASPASDLYSLGVLLYRMVTGGYPVEGADRTEIALAHREQRRRRVRDVRADLPTGFVQVIERTLSPDPRDRPQSAAELEDALARAVHPPRPTLVTWRSAAAIAAAIALAALPAWWMLRNRAGGAEPSSTTASLATAAPVATPSSTPAPPPAPAAAEYSIKATFFKQVDGEDIPLLPGDRVAPGDAIGMKLETSKPLHVYVVNIDDRGANTLLFPAEGLTPTNPLQPSKDHQLPGSDGGRKILWQVSNAGGREHFLVMANPEPLTAFEPVLASLARPKRDRAIDYKPLPESVIGQLRSANGLVAARPQKGTPWFGKVPLLSRDEESVKGTWVRQLTVRNTGR